MRNIESGPRRLEQNAHYARERGTREQEAASPVKALK